MAEITIDRAELETLLLQARLFEKRLVRLLEQHPKQKRSPPKVTVSAADWNPSDATLDWIAQRWGPIDYTAALQDFKDFFASNPPKSPGMWDAMLKKNPVFAGKLTRKQISKASNSASFDVKARAREIYMDLKSGQYRVMLDEFIGNDRLAVNWLLENSFVMTKNGEVVIK